MLLDDPTYHLFGIAGSRLRPSVDSGLINIQGYRQDRNQGGGGILLYIHAYYALHNKLKA